MIGSLESWLALTYQPRHGGASRCRVALSVERKKPPGVARRL
jgi:hypothetical protein